MCSRHCAFLDGSSCRCSGSRRIVYMHGLSGVHYSSESANTQWNLFLSQHCTWRLPLIASLIPRS